MILCRLALAVMLNERFFFDLCLFFEHGCEALFFQFFEHFLDLFISCNFLVFSYVCRPFLS